MLSLLFLSVLYLGFNGKISYSIYQLICRIWLWFCSINCKSCLLLKIYIQCYGFLEQFTNAGGVYLGRNFFLNWKHSVYYFTYKESYHLAILLLAHLLISEYSDSQSASRCHDYRTSRNTCQKCYKSENCWAQLFISCRI